jgi:hypothetical protein
VYIIFLKFLFSGEPAIFLTTKFLLRNMYFFVSRTHEWWQQLIVGKSALERYKRPNLSAVFANSKKCAICSIERLFEEFQEKIAFDGLWIDMNEPANFVAGDMNDGCAGEG